jgi:hypothetical protein
MFHGSVASADEGGWHAYGTGEYPLAHHRTREDAEAHVEDHAANHPGVKYDPDQHE